MGSKDRLSRMTDGFQGQAIKDIWWVPRAGNHGVFDGFHLVEGDRQSDARYMSSYIQANNEHVRWLGVSLVALFAFWL